MYFTYLLGWSKSKVFYYGVRYGKNAVEESVGKTYFSSSRYVRQFIKVNGEPDIVQIRKRFSTSLKAKRWEETVIRRIGCVKSERWLNKGNNDSFKDIVMTEEIAQRISEVKKRNNIDRPKLVFFNDGKVNRGFRDGDVIPDGWVKGKILSESQREWCRNMNSLLTPEMRKEAGKKTSATTKGVPKPEGFGQKLTEAQLGKPKPWNVGDNNPAKKEESRRKISEKKRGCRHYTDGVRLIHIKEGTQPEGFYLTTIQQFKKINEEKHKV